MSKSVLAIKVGDTSLSSSNSESGPSVWWHVCSYVYTHLYIYILCAVTWSIYIYIYIYIWLFFSEAGRWCSMTSRCWNQCRHTEWVIQKRCFPFWQQSTTTDRRACKLSLSIHVYNYQVTGHSLNHCWNCQGHHGLQAVHSPGLQSGICFLHMYIYIYIFINT